MVEQAKKRMIVSRYCVMLDDFEGIFKCNECGQEAAWQNENYEIRRCDNSECNGRMRLKLFKK